jgi:hypothetical protein
MMRRPVTRLPFDADDMVAAPGNPRPVVGHGKGHQLIDITDHGCVAEHDDAPPAAINVVIPAELTIALMGWVQMRVMTALNTIAPGPDGAYVFGTMPQPADLAEVGQAWMRMLTLQLGILLKPYLV